MARRRGLHPDTALEVHLSATARRLALAGADPVDVVDQLRHAADGRTDLLAIAAGQILGGWLARPGEEQPRTLRAVALLVEAGADPDSTAQQAELTRDALRRGHHTTSTTGGPPNGR